MKEVEHMNIELRLETPADYAETEKVVREAFWNVYAPGCTEHYLVHVMRSSENFVRELAFVAVADSKIVGCVMFVKGTIAGDDGVVREVLTLGPIAVLPAYQKKGVGRRLIDHARKEAIRQGYAAIVLCGDPLYYSRVGFEPAENFGIRTADNKYFVALQICPLQEKRPESFAGRYSDDAVTTSARRRHLNLIRNFCRKIASRTRRHKNDCWKLLKCSDRLTAQNAREPA